jgi:hypothetical protein
MQLTPMPWGFKLFILVLALGWHSCARLGERKVFGWVARWIGKVRDWGAPGRRKRGKVYKLLCEEIRM